MSQINHMNETNPQTWEHKLKAMKALSDEVIIEWEFTPPTYEKTNLIRPDQYTGFQFTGIVVNVGPSVSQDIQIGDRVFWDQYCQPKKYEDWESGKRFAIIREYQCIAKVDKRELSHV